jgi:hypothetical protein
VRDTSSNCHSHFDADVNLMPDGNGNIDTNSNGNSDSHGCSHIDCHRSGNCHIHFDADVNLMPDSNCNSHGNCYWHDGAKAYPDAQATSHAARPTPISFSI